MLPGVGVFLGSDEEGEGLGAALAGLLRARGFQLRALWAAEPGRALLVAARLAGPQLELPFATDSVDALLLRRDVALVLVAAAPPLRAQIAVKALGIGKHVVCEPPAGPAQADALRLVRAAQYYPALVAGLAHPLRFLAAAARARALLARGRLGALRRLDARLSQRAAPAHYGWRCEREMGGGALQLGQAHLVDLAAFLTGRRARQVHGLLRTFEPTRPGVGGIRQITAPDFCSFQMRADGELLVTATLDSCAAGPDYEQEITVCGELGRLTIRGERLLTRLRRPDDDKEVYDDAEYSDGEDADFPLPASTVPIPHLRGLGNMIEALKRAFLPAEGEAGWIKEPVESAATFEDGLYVQAVMEAIVKSDKEKRWVDVVLLAEQPDPNPLLSAAVRRTNISLQAPV